MRINAVRQEFEMDENTFSGCIGKQKEKKNNFSQCSLLTFFAL